MGLGPQMRAQNLKKGPKSVLFGLLGFSAGPWLEKQELRV